jgi:hypothetical protein
MEHFILLAAAAVQTILYRFTKIVRVVFGYIFAAGLLVWGAAAYSGDNAVTLMGFDLHLYVFLIICFCYLVLNTIVLTGKKCGEKSLSDILFCIEKSRIRIPDIVITVIMSAVYIPLSIMAGMNSWASDYDFLPALMLLFGLVYLIVEGIRLKSPIMGFCAGALSIVLTVGPSLFIVFEDFDAFVFVTLYYGAAGFIISTLSLLRSIRKDKEQVQARNARSLYGMNQPAMHDVKPVRQAPAARQCPVSGEYGLPGDNFCFKCGNSYFVQKK